jgi:ribose transport system ATP-binding protein
VLERVGLRVDLDKPVGTYSIGVRQLVEISRVLLEAPRLLILDEPNSALNERESERLFGVLRELSTAGVTQLYVSHRLQEVFAVSDDVTVMRNGRDVLTRERSRLTMSEVVTAMIGGSERSLYPDRQPGDATRRPALMVRDLNVGDELHDVSFEASAGEIVGLAGLEGSGVAALLGALFGLRRTTASGATYPDGRGIPGSPTEAARRGISLVPADRRHQGLMLHRSLARNIVHVRFGTLATGDPWLRRREMVAAARRQINDLQIKVRSATSSVHQLSGGNQQKVVIGKWLEVRPDVVLLDDPTRGVDIGAKREIYHLIRQLADDGRVVIFRSTELPELVGLADRILVLYRQRLVGEVRGIDIDDRALLHMINTGEMPPQSGRDDT